MPAGGTYSRVFYWAQHSSSQIVTELPPIEPVAVNTGGNFALRISSPFLNFTASHHFRGRHGLTASHTKFLLVAYFPVRTCA
jgi:hypothetical protein